MNQINRESLCSDNTSAICVNEGLKNNIGYDQIELYKI